MRKTAARLLSKKDHKAADDGDRTKLRAILSGGLTPTVAQRLIGALVVLHSLGFSLGFALSRYGFKRSFRTSITNSIEVGMQNSGLGAVLAAAHLPNGALAAVPCAISAAMHSIIGSSLAAIWSRRKGED